MPGSISSAGSLIPLDAHEASTAVHGIADTAALQADVAGKAPLVGAGDVEITDATKGLVLPSPDGSRWRVTVGNLGNATWTKIV